MCARPCATCSDIVILMSLCFANVKIRALMRIVAMHLLGPAVQDVLFRATALCALTHMGDTFAAPGMRQWLRGCDCLSRSHATQIGHGRPCHD